MSFNEHWIKLCHEQKKQRKNNLLNLLKGFAVSAWQTFHRRNTPKTLHKPGRFGLRVPFSIFLWGFGNLAVKVQQPEFENFDRKCNSFNGFYSHKSDLPKIYWAFDLWYLKARHNSGRSAPEKKYHKNNSCQSSSQDNASDLATARKKNKTAKV